MIKTTLCYTQVVQNSNKQLQVLDILGWRWQTQPWGGGLLMERLGRIGADPLAEGPDPNPMQLRLEEYLVSTGIGKRVGLKYFWISDPDYLAWLIILR